MAVDSRVGRFFSSIGDKLADQVWYQQAKVKWEELDAQTRMMLKYGGLALGVVLGVVLVFTAMLSVSSTKKEIDEKKALIAKIQASQEELRKLKEVTQGNRGGDASQPWSEYFMGQAGTAGLDTAGMTVGPEKNASTADRNNPDKPKETLIDVTVKKVNIRQLVRFVHGIENGGRTAKVRNLLVDAQPDESGYLDVTIAVSGFTFAPKL